MGGNYSMPKIFIAGEILYAADLNAAHETHITNATPAGLDDYSSTLVQMQTVTDPYPGESPTLATDLAGEIARIRYQFLLLLKVFKSDASYWYEDPTYTALNEAVTAIDHDDTPYTVLGTDTVILADCGTGTAAPDDITVNVITAVGNEGKIVRVVKIDSEVNTVTVDADGTETIDGELTFVLRYQYEGISFISDGANWKRLDKRPPFAATGREYKNLIVKTVAAATHVDIDADWVIVSDANNNRLQLEAIDLTCQLGDTGVDGRRDGITTAENQALYLFVIYTPAAETVASFADTTIVPTLPAGYTHWKLVSWCTTDETADPFNVEEFEQHDTFYQWGDRQLILTAGLARAATAIDLSSAGASTYDVVPASICDGLSFTFINSTTTNLSWGPTALTCNNKIYQQASTVLLNGVVAGVMNILIESQTMYYLVNAGNTTIVLTSFRLKL